MEAVHKRVAGIAVHRMKHIATILIEQAYQIASKGDRSFGSMHAILHRAPRRRRKKAVPKCLEYRSHPARRAAATQSMPSSDFGEANARLLPLGNDPELLGNRENTACSGAFNNF
jgi:hypothetical protein